MSDNEEAIRLAGAALRRLHDISDVVSAIGAASRLVRDELDHIELALLAVAGHIRSEEEGAP